MQVSSKWLVRTSLVLLGLMLVTMVFVTVVNSQQASATSGDDLTTVRGYVADYITKQYAADAVYGESGFVVDREWVKTRIDTDGDMLTTGAVLDEGDDAANAPLLIDTLKQASVVAGTGLQCNYNNGTGGVPGVSTTNCFDSGEITLVKTMLDNRAAAGFSTDIVSYCLTEHTGSPAVGGWGFIAQTGALRSDGSIPNVYNIKWGLSGWKGTAHAAYTRTGVLTPTATATTNAIPTTAPPTCSDSDPLTTAGDAELVRCQAQWAIYSANPINGATGGNVGNGINPTGTTTLSLAGSQIVDIRTGNPNSVWISGKPTISNPINEVFTDAGMAKLDSSLAGGTAGIIVVGRTQMTSGIVAMGLKMLGEPVGTNGYMKDGMPNWNMDQDEKANTVALTTYPTPVASTIDKTPPVVSSVGHTNVGTTTADIERVAGEPASIRVDYGTSSGAYTAFQRNTELNASRTVAGGDAFQLTGLTPGTTYYYQVTSYDGQANPTVSAEGSFATGGGCVGGKPSLTLAAPAPFWGSYADYLAKTLSVTWTVNNTGTEVANNVNITSSNSTYAPITTVPGWAAIGNIAAGSSGSTVIQYVLPTVGSGFRVVNTASAEDCAAVGYTYP